jgi:PPOX class probable F420-dependent enzyme
VAHLATLCPDGRPHQVPIVFAVVGGALWSPIDGKPKAGGEPARVRNIRGQPAASVLLDDYGPDWRQLWWLRVDGRARVMEGGRLAGSGELASVEAALRAKYPQYGDVPLFRGAPMLLRIAVERLRSWCAGPAAREAAARAAGAS